MITCSSTKVQSQTWQKLLANGIRTPQELLQQLNLSDELLIPAELAAREFKLRVPHSFVMRMKKGDSNDPLLRQVLPTEQELIKTSGFISDPLQENLYNPIPGLLHKYPGRVLLTLTSSCAIHCRYCFRRYFPYEDNTPGLQGWQQALTYIAKNSTIHEVILSGGDPLTVTDDYLKHFIEKLTGIPHITTLRIHSRLPIVLPERITLELTDILTRSRLQSLIVLHCNHAQEIDANVMAAIDNLRQRKIMVLNQTVLLKNVNDNSETLTALSEKLFSAGVLPYYLHLPDQVMGTAHFWVEEDHAIQLINTLRATLPGYLVPRLMREIPGKSGKTLIA